MISVVVVIVILHFITEICSFRDTDSMKVLPQNVFKNPTSVCFAFNDVTIVVFCKVAASLFECNVK